MGTLVPQSAYKMPYCGLPPRLKYGKIQRPHSAEPGRGAKRSDKKPGPGYYSGAGLEKGYRQVYDRRPIWSLKGTGYDVPAIGNLGKQKVPGPGQYPVKEAFEATIPRVPYGKMLPKRTRPQSAPPRAGGPGGYNIQHIDPHMGAPDFKIRKTDSRSTKKDLEPGPGAYNVKEPLEHKPAPDFARSLHKTQPRPTVKTDKVPGPGFYPAVSDRVYTRGAKWSQLHGVGRSPLHGTY